MATCDWLIPHNVFYQVMYAAANLAEELQHDAQDYGLHAQLGDDRVYCSCLAGQPAICLFPEG